MRQYSAAHGYMSINTPMYTHKSPWTSGPGGWVGFFGSQNKFVANKQRKLLWAQGVGWLALWLFGCLAGWWHDVSCALGYPPPGTPPPPMGVFVAPAAAVAAATFAWQLVMLPTNFMKVDTEPHVKSGWWCRLSRWLLFPNNAQWNCSFFPPPGFILWR